MDFTSALYLGITHDSRSLRWHELTTGTPAVIRRTAATAAAEQAFAALVGCERAVALTSTLHGFVDLFAQVGDPGVVVLHDAGVYPIACWGMERARLRGARVLPFRHHDPAALERRLAQLGRRVRPWVVSDGFCPGCGQVAPLDAYAALIRRFAGRMVIDDTQAVGVLGAAPTPTAPLGTGGGGSLRRWSLAGDDLLVVASLAKGFGAPLAMLAGGRRIVECFTARSDTLVHCSPPSAAAVAAALHALSINARRGEALRARLVARVRGLRRSLRRRGFPPRGGLFPVQCVPIASSRAATALQRALARRGVRVVAARSRCTSQIALMFLVTARHGEAEIDFAATALAAAAWGGHGSRLDLPSTAEA